MTIRDPINLVVCCDGTGNVWKPGPEKTNVVKLVESLVSDPLQQLHFYDPGVGTPDGYISENPGWRDTFRRLAGLIWGDGVWANVAAAYAFLIHHYQEGDRIYLFGFSRGAFTARAVAGLVNLFGILRREHENLIPTLLQVYRTKPTQAPQQAGVSNRSEIGESIRANFTHLEKTCVHFIGVWDTVESVGLSQLALGTHITSEPTVKPCYRNIRHALALDELRWPYQPRLYIEPENLPDDQTFKQVWFAGAHSDVGGGYKESGLANAALHWMAREASFQGLLVNFNQLDNHPVNALDTLHDEAAQIPFWTAVGTFKRDLPEKIVIHESVHERMTVKGANYQPALSKTLGIAVTPKIYINVHRREVDSPVPKSPPDKTGKPLRQGIRGWHIGLWTALAIAVALVFSLHSGQAFELATLQIEGWKGELCGHIAQWTNTHRVSIGELLKLDTLAIVLYAPLLCLSAFLLSRAAAPNGAVSPKLGKLLMYSSAFAPLADLAENMLTAALVPSDQVHGDVCGGWSATLFSYATFLASFIKYAWLCAFLGGAVCCLMSAVASKLRRQHALG